MIALAFARLDAAEDPGILIHDAREAALAAARALGPRDGRPLLGAYPSWSRTTSTWRACPPAWARAPAIRARRRGTRAIGGVGEIELPAPGLGELNYDLYFQPLSKKHPNIPMIIEHLEEADVPRAKKFLDGKLRANGL